MNEKTTILMLTAALGLAIANVPSVDAQTTLGGARPQQNKIGGVAKPAPLVGGATVHAYSPAPPKPAGAVVNLANKPGTTPPGSIGTVRPLGQTAGNPPPHPAFTPPNRGKSNTVVGASSNLKCSGGACTSRGAKR
ncbi:hypothetical protein [Bradyrhizobium sp.]|uniref:hypothetical protein n=1 Tax=Bradyrhizobium sp. TaxID=376 RepID=UPI00261B7516|nr:hypothetical protein [Bradyrhizobium sp.]